MGLVVDWKLNIRTLYHSLESLYNVSDYEKYIFYGILSITYDIVLFYGILSFFTDSELEDLETPPRYRPDSLESLCRATRFTQAEIKRIYRGFKAECPTGVVREETFKMIYAQFFPQGGEYTISQVHFHDIHYRFGILSKIFIFHFFSLQKRYFIFHEKYSI